MSVSRDERGWLWGRAALTSPFEYRRWILFAILAAAFALRLGLALRLPTVHYADEVYQVAEQANRSATGYGIVPWEFQARVRPALLPGLVLPIYELHVTATTHRVLQAALFCALSLIPVWIAFQWAGRLYGPLGAAIAASMMATWFEVVYFAPKPLPDIVCSYFLLAGLFLARPSAHRREIIAAGCALVIALALRVQITPAVGVAALLALLAGGRQRLVALAIGAAIGLIIAGGVDYLWWGVPFQGQVGYLRMEFVHHASRLFAREPVTFYLKQYALMLGPALPAFAFLVWLGMRRAPVLLIVALAVVVPFHLIGHKEYRFVVAAAPLFVLLMGLAAADLVQRLDLARKTGAMTMLLAGWLAAMATVCYGDYYRPLWTRYGNNVLAFEAVGRDPEACGVALVGVRWFQTPGYSGIGRDVPIYDADSPGGLDGENELTRIRAAANYMLLGTKQTPPPAPYVAVHEYARPSQFLYRRPGGCTADASRRIELPAAPPGILSQP